MPTFTQASTCANSFLGSHCWGGLGVEPSSCRHSVTCLACRSKPSWMSSGLACAAPALVQFPRTCCVKAGPVVSLAMEPPLFVRPLTAEERQQLHAGLHARDAFTLRRCQILLAS